MTKTKYVMSGGLAFAEQKDMEILSSYAKKGWHVKRWAFMGYLLEQGEPKDVVYTIDHRELGDDREEYFELFTATDWDYVASSGHTHLFCSTRGAKPIYNNDETVVEKYEAMAKPLHLAAIPMAALTILGWLFTASTSSTLHTILFIIAALLTVVTIPIVWTTVAAYRLKWQAEQKSGHVSFTKILPVIILIAAIAALFISEQNVVITIAAAVTGAIVFPFLFTIIIAAIYKVKKA